MNISLTSVKTITWNNFWPNQSLKWLCCYLFLFFFSVYIDVIERNFWRHSVVVLVFRSVSSIWCTSWMYIRTGRMQISLSALFLLLCVCVEKKKETSFYLILLHCLSCFYCLWNDVFICSDTDWLIIAQKRKHFVV